MKLETQVELIMLRVPFAICRVSLQSSAAKGHTVYMLQPFLVGCVYDLNVRLPSFF